MPNAKNTLSAAAVVLATAYAPANAQEGALDEDPYFTSLPANPYGTPARATDSATSSAKDGASATAAPRALPRPRRGQTLAYAAPAASLQSAPAAAAEPSARAAARPLTAYIEGRAGFDAIRGVREDDGILFGATAGFDRALARFGGGQFYAGLLASIDFSSAERADSVTVRDETGPNPILTQTEQSVEEMRDIEVGARLGWRGSRFGIYLMAAISNAKREAVTVTTTFTETVDPDDTNAVLLTPTGTQTIGPGGMYADGLRLGGGFEARVIGPAYLHVGYRFTDDDAGTERHQVLTGVGARF